MASYRFCRPDDIPRLVAGFDACWRAHVPDAEPFTVERFRELMKRIDLWPSSCMLALEGDAAIAVMLGTRRDTEALVWRIVVRPGHERQGHASHLLTSISGKLAVLGPPRLVGEASADDTVALALAAANGYREEARFVDWIREPTPTPSVQEGLVGPVSWDELEGAGVLVVPDGTAWRRQEPSLRADADELGGLAVASPSGFLGWLLYELADDGGGSRVRAWWLGPDPERRELVLGLLVRSLAARHDGRLVLASVGEDEIPGAWLEALGFVGGTRTLRLTAPATPG